MDLKGSRTAKNLMVAFAGESQATARYNLYAKVAEYEGYVQIADIFRETARNEEVHGDRFYKFLREEYEGQDINVNHNYPVAYKRTSDNLASAYEGEHGEAETMYPEFADIADEEGFHVIADVFREIAKVEKAHMTRFLKLYENIQEGRVFKREEKVLWKCNNCGYIYEGKEPPMSCPACMAEKAYFELFVETY